MSYAAERLKEHKRKRAEALVAAEQEATANGKELFDLARLEAALNRGAQASREQDHRVNYYLLHPEFRTLAEYAKSLIDGEPWEDAK